MTKACEWPNESAGSRIQCGRPAKFVVNHREPTPEHPGWERHVCGTHRNRALRIGWVEVGRKG